MPFGYFGSHAKLASPPMPAECAWQAPLEPPFPPPRLQAHRDGIVPSTVACNEGLVLHLRAGGYIEPPPVPFVPSPPERPDAGRPRQAAASRGRSGAGRMLTAAARPLRV